MYLVFNLDDGAKAFLFMIIFFIFREKVIFVDFVI